MKNLNIVVILILILFVGCSKDNFESGRIKGTVEYGQGDCMPIIDYKSRKYDNYEGKLFFIKKEDFDNLENGNLDQLKNNSIIISIKQGKLSTELPIGTYLVIPENVYLHSEENTITIKSRELLNKDFSFWKCISF